MGKDLITRVRQIGLSALLIAIPLLSQGCLKPTSYVAKFDSVNYQLKQGERLGLSNYTPIVPLFEVKTD